MRYVFLVPTATAAVFIFGAVEAGGLSLFPIFAVRAHFTESQAALLLTMMGVGNVIFQIPLGLLSDRIPDKRPLLAGMALMGFVGSMMLPVLVDNWLLMAGLLLFWGGCVSGLYTVGLSHLGSRSPVRILRRQMPPSSSVMRWEPWPGRRRSGQRSMSPEITALPGRLPPSSAFTPYFPASD